MGEWTLVAVAAAVLVGLAGVARSWLRRSLAFLGMVGIGDSS